MAYLKTDMDNQKPADATTVAKCGFIKKTINQLHYLALIHMMIKVS
jgi:hypothetical protein